MGFSLMARSIRNSETEICCPFDVSYFSVGEKWFLFTVYLFISQLRSLFIATVILPEGQT